MKEVVIIDMEGTIINTSTEKGLKPTLNTAFFLCTVRQRSGADIVYLSSRRAIEGKEIRMFLRKVGFPHGKLILCKKGQDRENFKELELKKLVEKYDVRLIVSGDRDLENFGAEHVVVEQNNEWGKEIRRKILNLST